MADIVGSVWKYKDRRENRHVKVEKVESFYAYVRPCLPDGTEVAGGRRSRVLTINNGVRVVLRGYRRVPTIATGEAGDA